MGTPSEHFMAPFSVGTELNFRIANVDDEFVIPSRNKQFKKLLHFYWEVCPKYDENVKQEMILVVCLSTPSCLDPKLTTPVDIVTRSAMTWYASFN